MKKMKQYQSCDMYKIIIIFSIIWPSNLIAQNNKINTGNYGLISLISKNDSIFGVFKYYTNWKSNLKEFESKNNFYFYGSAKTNTSILKVTNPLEKENFGDESSGIISIRKDSIFYTQKPLEGMFQPDFFPNNLNKNKKGYSGKFMQKKEWKGIRFVKNPKSFFYDSLGKKAQKSYLVSGDVVYVLFTRNDLHYVEYYKNDSNIIVAKGWIKEIDLYNSNPENW